MYGSWQWNSVYICTKLRLRRYKNQKLLLAGTIFPQVMRCQISPVEVNSPFSQNPLAVRLPALTSSQHKLQSWYACDSSSTIGFTSHHTDLVDFSGYYRHLSTSWSCQYLQGDLPKITPQWLFFWSLHLLARGANKVSLCIQLFNHPTIQLFFYLENFDLLYLFYFTYLFAASDTLAENF